MVKRNKPKHRKQDPTQGELRGTLPVIKGKLTQDEVDSLAERTQPLIWTKAAREKGC